MRKKLFCNYIILAFITVLCFALSSCGDDDGNTDNAGKRGYIDDYAYVDLGLSVKWATKNIGAATSTDAGSYFAWGEVAPKNNYTLDTYKWCQGTETSMAKYCVDSNYGTPDNKSQLETADDAAVANMGGSWRMPTETEWRELKTQCTWTWYGAGNTEFGGVQGYKVQSRVSGNDNYIFLPATGFYAGTQIYHIGGATDGEYWSSSLSTRNFEALVCWFTPDDGKNSTMLNGSRCEGRAVRAVHP